MNTLTDQALTDALSAAAGTFPDPAGGTDELLAELDDEDVDAPWWRRRTVQLVSVAAALLIAVLLVQTALPSVLSEDTTSRNTAVAPQDDLGEVHPLPQGGTDAAGGTTGGALGAGGVGLPEGYSSTPDVAGAPAVAPQETSGRSSTKDSGASTAAQDTTRVVKTGSVSLVVDDGKVGAALTKIRSIATSVRGFVSEEQSQELGDNPSATITLRVPVASFESVMTQLRSKGFGAKVVNADSTGRDVSASYADTQAQIKSLQAARNRYLSILNRATTIGQVLEVQQRVDEVQGQIDRLEGSRRLLASQSDLATLTVSVAEEGSEVLRTEEPGGFSQAWDDARDGFTSGVQAIIAHSGRVLLVLIVTALLLVGGRSAWRLARRRMV
jgi:hypothetical protein